MKGIITSVVTPFGKNGEIRLDPLTVLSSFNTSRGVDGFWVLGTTGEFNMLTIEEKVSVTKKFSELSKEIIAGVSENSLVNAIKLAKEYADIGVKSIFSTPPIYHKPNEKGLITFFDGISKFSEKVYIYNIPSLVGYNVNLDVIIKLIDEGIIQGIKYTTQDFESFIKYLKETKRIKKEFEVFVGNDHYAMISLMYGADGVVSAVSNYAPEVMSNIYKNVKERNYEEAYKFQMMADMLSDSTSLTDYPCGVKIALRYRGIDVGSCRKPLEENIMADSSIYYTLKELNL
ncbi:dihydrodipicolinate synthetase [Candidatus Acidianus copahuensis]|uniref:Dihydrodipicolinate synthetase n=1 Tax=Candidatus Acidianus copahuensis TaxID=1160895 RepID=A0A031LIW2_9CREN|nr:dihydrodipicolinate synthase family protein [Candidatus Acidianus copahuensis]EZQ02082.1 dihydrodipicolinate synthetase [Candidatus Acidianus copahuensis]